MNKKVIRSILEQYKSNSISFKKAYKMLAVAFEVDKSIFCELDRLPKECSIFLYTSSKDCTKCGHYIKD